MVFHVTEYGAVVSSVAKLAPSSLNWTPTTPTSSDADADTVTEVPDKMAAAAGTVIEIAGGVLSAVGGGDEGAEDGEVLGTIPQIGTVSNPLWLTVFQLLALVKRAQAAEAPGAP